MNLLLLDPSEVDAFGRATLSGRRAAHAREVLRVQHGDMVRVGVRHGLVGTATVLSSTAEKMELAVDAREPPPERPRIDVILAVPRPKALKRIIPALASFGVDRVVLVNAARVEKSYFDAKVLAPEVLAAHADLGLEQGRDTVPPIITIRKRLKPFVEDELAEWASGAHRLLLHPGPVEHAARETSRRRVLAVGPDGGWVPFELELFRAHGFLPCALGPRPLRVEVAVPAIIGALL